MATAQQQLDGFLKKYTPGIATLGRDAITHMRKRLPGAICPIYDNYNALAVGFGPDDRVKTLPLSIALYPRWGALFFMSGSTLPDPELLLSGKGARVRSIRFDTLDVLKSDAVDNLLTAAVLQAGWKLDPKARGKLVIKSISANQRPRRP
jgi:hypothetical protein